MGLEFRIKRPLYIYVFAQSVWVWFWIPYYRWLYVCSHSNISKNKKIGTSLRCINDIRVRVVGVGAKTEWINFYLELNKRAPHHVSKTARVDEKNDLAFVWLLREKNSIFYFPFVYFHYYNLRGTKHFKILIDFLFVVWREINKFIGVIHHEWQKFHGMVFVAGCQFHSRSAARWHELKEIMQNSYAVYSRLHFHDLRLDDIVSLFHCHNGFRFFNHIETSKTLQ